MKLLTKLWTLKKIDNCMSINFEIKFETILISMYQSTRIKILAIFPKKIEKTKQT